jgi:hypothetical protein
MKSFDKNYEGDRIQGHKMYEVTVHLGIGELYVGPERSRRLERSVVRRMITFTL